MSEPLNTPTETPLAPPSGDPAASPAKVDTMALDGGQIAAMRQEWLKHGLDPAAFDAMLKEDGIELPGEDTRTPEEREFDAAFGGAQPDGYRIDFIGRTGPDVTPEQIAAADQVSKAWLAEIGLEPSIGAAVVEQAIDVGNRVGRMDEGERELWRREQDALFIKVAGSDQRAVELLDHLTKVLERGDPGYRELLAKCGALDDAMVRLNLALHGERLTARQGKAA